MSRRRSKAEVAVAAVQVLWLIKLFELEDSRSSSGCPVGLSPSCGASLWRRKPWLVNDSAEQLGI
jgi:hypothetical protein